MNALKICLSWAGSFYFSMVTTLPPLFFLLGAAFTKFRFLFAKASAEPANREPLYSQDALKYQNRHSNNTISSKKNFPTKIIYSILFYDIHTF